MDRKKECLSCINMVFYDSNHDNDCVCAEECINFDQWYLDKEVIEKEQKEAIEIIEEIYKESNGAWGDVVISEDLYNRMEKLIKAYV